MSEPVFLVALLMVAGTVTMVARTIAAAIGGRRANAELSQIRDQLDQHANAIEDAQQQTALQNTQIAELQERLDFAERMLAQSRDRQALKPGDQA